MIEHDILHTHMILCHDILHGDGLLYLEDVYRTDKVTRVAQDDCGPTDGYMSFILLAALLQYCLVQQPMLILMYLAGWVNFIPTWCAWKDGVVCRGWIG